jgi:large conductance mechanosensitive channel
MSSHSIFGEPDLNEVGTFTINGAHFSIGLILTAVINFLLVAAAVYFVLIAPMNAFRESQAKVAEEEPPAPPEDLLVLQEIRNLSPGPPERDLTTGQLGSGDSTPAG